MRRGHSSRVKSSNRLRLIASRNARDGSLRIHQDVDLYASILEPGSELAHRFEPGRKGWLQVVNGKLLANDVEPGLAGDGASVEDVEQLRLEAAEKSEFLLFDIA